MKKLFLINAGLLALAMTACQSEEPIGSEQPGNGSTTTVPTDGQFIAINLSNAANAKSRASFEFEDGSDAENEINFDQLRFLFYTSTGEAFKMTGNNISGDVISDADGATNMIKPMKLTTDKVNNQVTSFANAVLVLGQGENNGYEGAAMPARIICVANASDEMLAQYKNQPMSKVEEILHNTVTDGTAGSFVMTSSTYWSNGKKYWSDITADNIRPTTGLAQEHPVQIYIERLAARVDVTAFPQGKTNGMDNHFITEIKEEGENTTTEKFNLTYVDWDPESKSIVTVENKAVWAEACGWNVNTLANKSFGIKQIVNFSSSDAGDDHFFKNLNEWNVGVRSFWSKTATDANPATATVPEAFIPEEYFSKKAGDQVYVYANTADPELQGNEARGNDAFRGKVNFARTHATKIIVGANLTIVEPNATSAGSKDFKMMYWGGTYYTPEALCRSIAQWHNIKDASVVFVRNDGPGDKSASDKNQNFNVSFYKIPGGTDWGVLYDIKDIVDTNAIKIDPAQYWDGMCYYIVNISNQTYATAKADKPEDAPEMYGVMRNTIYSYKLNNFVGLGTPIVDPTLDVDVENPAYGETFVAAQLSILKWRVVSHSTILQ